MTGGRHGRRATEGTEYLSHARAHTQSAKVETLQTLRKSTMCRRVVTHCEITEGLEGLEVNRHTRARGANKPSVPSVLWPVPRGHLLACRRPDPS